MNLATDSRGQDETDPNFQLAPRAQLYTLCMSLTHSLQQKTANFISINKEMQYVQQQINVAKMRLILSLFLKFFVQRGRVKKMGTFKKCL